MSFMNEKLKHVKNALRLFIEKGRSFSWILLTFLFISSGIGYLFIDNSRTYKIFGEELLFPKSVINKFFNNNSGLYMIHMGYYYDAKKHGITMKPSRIKEKLESLDIFHNNNKFDSKLLNEFLKNNQMLYRELWEYCEQLCVNDCYKKCWNNMQSPMINKFTKLLFAKSGGTIKGIQLTLKQDIKMPEENDFLVSIFIRKQILQQKNTVLTDERRSGKVYVFKQNKKIDTSKNLADQNPIKIHEFTNVVNGESEISDVLFASDYIIINGYKMISYVSNIEPRSIKVMNIADWNSMKKQFYEEQKRIKKLNILLEYSEKFNHGDMTKNQLLQLLNNKNITVKLVNYSHNNVLFAATPPGKSCVFSDVDENPSIFLCESFIPDSAGEINAMDGIMDKIPNDSIINLQILQWINYYIQRSYNEQK